VKLKIKAIGGSYINGLGFQLDDLVPADISAITGQVLTQNLITRNANNTEAGQAKAVVICYDSPEPIVNRVGGSMFNTIKTNGVGTTDTMRVNISFTTPIVATKLTLDKFNPFIFTNKRRGYEVHLPNFVPTDLANTSVLGTFADISNPSAGTYYKTANGMPWAMIIPEDFVYPKEKAAITTAYNFFDDWVLSNGTANTNWFTNIVGNRNEAEVY
jgi:LruC domain-containing protein